MSLFKKKRIMKIVDDSETVVSDFICRRPFWSYRTVRYREYEPFVSFGEMIDGFLEKQFSGEIDSGNGNTLDNLIGDMARQAENDLKRQRAEHKDTIRAFDTRVQGDRKSFEYEHMLLKAELERNNDRRNEIRERSDNDKFTGGRYDS